MKTYIIDVREPHEFLSGHVEGALNIPPQELLSGSGKIEGIPKDSRIILYCKTGSRSNVSKQILTSMGYENVINGINKDHVNAKYKEKS